MRKTDDEFLKDIYKKEKEYRDKQRKRKKQIITITLSSAVCVAAAFAIFTPYRNLKTGGNGTTSISEEQLEGATADVTDNDASLDTYACDIVKSVSCAEITFENGEQKQFVCEDYESLRSLFNGTESDYSSESSKKDLGESDYNNRSEVFSNSSEVLSVVFRDEKGNVSQYTLDGNCLTENGTNSKTILSDNTLRQIINIIYGD